MNLASCEFGLCVLREQEISLVTQSAGTKIQTHGERSLLLEEQCLQSDQECLTNASVLRRFSVSLYFCECGMGVQRELLMCSLKTHDLHSQLAKLTE